MVENGEGPQNVQLLSTELIPEEFELYQFQVAGHRFNQGKHGNTGVLRRKVTGSVLKPVQNPPRGEREIAFYEMLRSGKDDTLLRLRRFVPNYYGCITVPIRDTECRYLELENLTEGFQKPCVLDVKMGGRTWDPYASPEKINYEKTKYPWGELLGFRLLGLKVFDPHTQSWNFKDKEWGKSITIPQIQTELLYFLGNRQGAERNNLINNILCQLEAILGWFEVETKFHFYSSSILITYEGSGNISPNVVVKMIDFTHVFEDSTSDQNYIFGLKNLIERFKATVDC